MFRAVTFFTTITLTITTIRIASILTKNLKAKFDSTEFSASTIIRSWLQWISYVSEVFIKIFCQIINFSFSVTLILCIALIIPLAVYLYIPEFRSSFHGKLCISILSLHLFMILCYTFLHIGFDFHHYYHMIIAFVITAALVLSDACLTMMCFDIFMSFKWVLIKAWALPKFTTASCFK